MDVGTHGRIEASNRSLHDDTVGNDVVANAAADSANRDDGGPVGQIHLPTRDCLQTLDDLRRDDDWVHTTPWLRTVRAFAVYGDQEVVRARHDAARAILDLAGMKGQHVQSEYRVDVRILERAFADHHARTAVLADRNSFFGRLEDELDRSRNSIAHPAEHRRNTHQHRRMRVVAAGVRHARFLTV